MMHYNFLIMQGDIASTESLEKHCKLFDNLKKCVYFVLNSIKKKFIFSIWNAYIPTIKIFRVCILFFVFVFVFIFFFIEKIL
jgi:hypothetical protein